MTENKPGYPENAGPSEPPPYSPPTSAAYPPAAGMPYPPAAGMPYPPAAGMPYPPPQQPTPQLGFSPTIYQTTPPHNDAIIRSTQHQTVTTTQVMVGVPTCPQCRIGTLEETFTPLGICCAIFLFPIGLLFCMMMRRKICAHCGAIYM